MRGLIISAFLAFFSLPSLLLAIEFTKSSSFDLSYSAGWATPAIADINNDGVLDIVSAGSSGAIEAYTINGDFLWSTVIPGAACEFTNSGDRLYSSPSIGSLHGDGTMQIVVGFGGFNGKACDGGVASVNGVDGSIDWVFSIKSWAKKTKQFSFRNAVISTPALGDDGTGKLMVGVGSFARHIYLLNHDGTLRWTYQAADTIWSSAVFTNSDSDSRLEMVIGSDISANKKIKPITKNGGYILTFDTKQFTKGIVSFRDPNKRILQGIEHFEQTIYSSPVVGDVFAGSPGDEIVVGSGCFFPQGKNPKDGMWFKVLSSKNKTLFTLPFDSCSSSSPALIDVNGDGVKDIIGAVSGGNGGSGIPMMRAYSVASGTVEQLWEVEANSPQAFQSPVAVEGDEPFIIQPSSGKLKIVSAKDGSVVQDISVGGSFLNNPVVADVNGDSVPDIVVTGSGKVRIFQGISTSSFPVKRSAQWR